jgi:hypothetical protein
MLSALQFLWNSSSQPSIEPVKPINEDWVFVPRATRIVDIESTFLASAASDVPAAPAASDVPPAPAAPSALAPTVPAAPAGALLAQILTGAEALTSPNERKEALPREECHLWHKIRARRDVIEQSMTLTGSITDSWLK